MRIPNPKSEILDVPPNDRLVRVSVVEDDDVVREQLVYQLKRVAGFLLASSHRSGEDAVETIPREKPPPLIECTSVMSPRSPLQMFSQATRVASDE